MRVVNECKEINRGRHKYLVINRTINVYMSIRTKKSWAYVGSLQQKSLEIVLLISFLYYNFKMPNKTNCWIFFLIIAHFKTFFHAAISMHYYIVLKITPLIQEETFSMCLTNMLNLYHITLQYSVTLCKKSQNVKSIYRVKKEVLFSHFKTIFFFCLYS